MAYPSLAQHVQEILDEFAYWEKKIQLRAVSLPIGLDSEQAQVESVAQLESFSHAADGCRKEIQEAVDLLRRAGLLS